MGATSRMRRGGVGTTNRESMKTMEVSPSSRRALLPASPGKTGPVADMRDPSFAYPLSTSWDSAAITLPKLTHTISWNAEPPSLPGKSKLYKKTLRPLTPPEEDVVGLINNVQTRIAQMKIGTVPQMFLNLDTNRNGCIEKAEVRQFLQNLNEYTSEDKLDKFYEYMDMKSDGVVDYTEFCKALCVFPEKDADELVKRGRGVEQEGEGADVLSTQYPRRKPVAPPTYKPYGNLHGASLSYSTGDLAATMSTMGGETSPAKSTGRSTNRKKIGRQHSRRVGPQEKSGARLMSKYQTDDIAELLKENATQRNRTLLDWHRWIGKRPGCADVMDHEEFRSLIQDNLHVHVSSDQIAKLVEDLGLTSSKEHGVDVDRFCEKFGPKSLNPVFKDAEEPWSLNAKNSRSLSRSASFKHSLGATSLSEMSPVLDELAAQVQTGPTAVNHSQMLREFRKADTTDLGTLSVGDFTKTLSKVMGGTALKDIGIPSIETLGASDVDYNYFIDACTGMGSAYLKAEGAPVTSLSRYDPMDRIGQSRTQQMRAAEPFSPSVSQGSSGSPGQQSFGDTMGSWRQPATRFPKGGWDPMVDQTYKNTDHISVPAESTSHFAGRADQHSNGWKHKSDEELYFAPRHPALNVPEGKLRRMNEQRMRAEGNVMHEDLRPQVRHAARVQMFATQNKAYRSNLEMDDRNTARHMGDTQSAVRFQPFGDLLAQSNEAARTVRLVEPRDMSGGTAEAATRQTTQYARLPFVGR